jgi:hypothetical protein
MPMISNEMCNQDRISIMTAAVHSLNQNGGIINQAFPTEWY